MKRIILLAMLAATGRLLAQNITECRWWINDDIATLSTASIAPAADATLNAALDLPVLTKSYNTITLQFKDSNGEWSVPQTTWCSRRTGAANGYEYWIDDDIANAFSGSIGPNTVVDLIADLPTGVPAGSHTFTIRFSSANSTWSVPLTAQFTSTVSIDELPGITELILFPNPVTEQLGLRLNTDAARTLKLEVHDLRGAVVLGLSTWSVSGSAYRNWDMSDLASGSYVLRITDEDRVWSTRFVKH